LPDDAWDQHYDLSLRLFAGAVETAYLSAQWERLKKRSLEIKKHARTTMDQLVAWEAEIDAHAGRHEYLQAIEAGRSVLQMLGVELPRDPGEAEVGAAFQQTLARLTEIGPEGLNALPDVDDPKIAAVTRIQVRLSPVAYFGQPLLLPIIASNLVTTSIDRGLSTSTPYGLSLFGIVLNTLDMYSTSNEWGQLALKMIQRWPDRRLEAATRHILHNLVCSWMVPLESILEPVREVFEIGRRSGDYEYGSYAAHGYIYHSLYAGRPLGPLTEEAITLSQQMAEFGVNAHIVHKPFEQLLKALTGQLEEPETLNGEGFNEETLLSESGDSAASAFMLYHVMGLTRYYFGKAQEASECLERARGYLQAAPSTWHQAILQQFAALAAAAAWDETDDTAARTEFRKHIEAGIDRLSLLAELAPFNFAHRVHLLKAELLRIDGNLSDARHELGEALRLAQAGKWLSDVALAHELTARCAEDELGAKASLRAARTAYTAWGASAKVAQLTRRIEALG
jgi:predicted ATPase